VGEGEILRCDSGLEATWTMGSYLSPVLHGRGLLKGGKIGPPEGKGLRGEKYLATTEGVVLRKSFFKDYLEKERGEGKHEKSAWV